MKKATWQETMLASREALARLESEGSRTDRLKTWVSPILRRGNPATHVSLPVSGQKELYLFVVGAPEVVAGCATWADAKLVAPNGAETRSPDRRNKELNSTIVDLKILAGLASYHSRRALAGVAWALFARTNDVSALDEAIAHEKEAVRAWEEIVKAAADVYHDDLAFGQRQAGLAGHWKDELVLLRKGLAGLERRREDFRPVVAGPEPLIAHVPIRRTPPGKDLVVRATASGKEPIERVRVGYRSGASNVAYADMTQTTPFVYRAAIPASAVKGGLSYFIEATDAAGRSATWPPDGKTKFTDVVVTDDTESPTVAHEKIASAPAEKPLTVAAAVRDPSGVKWVRLRYRGVSQTFDYQTLPMLPTGKPEEYRAEVPAEHVDPQWDFMYFIEVMDNCGNGKIYPDLEQETPYVVVRLQR